MNYEYMTAPCGLACFECIVYLANENEDLRKTLAKKEFLQNVIDKRLGMGIKIPEWLELQKDERKGIVLRLPVRSDVTAPIAEHLIVELYSK